MKNGPKPGSGGAPRLRRPARGGAYRAWGRFTNFIKNKVFQYKFIAFYDLQNISKPLATQRFGASEKMNRIPYQTCCLLILLAPISEKGTQKY